MSRLIDADKIDYRKYHLSRGYTWDECEKVAEIIKEQPTVPQWIPVSDRLPTEKGEYLVTYHPCYWDDVFSETMVGLDTFRGKTTWAKRKHQRVIAWMEMPEAYRK